jgi:hypothetical protein
MARHKQKRIKGVILKGSGRELGWEASCECGWSGGVVRRKAIAEEQIKDHIRKQMAQ